MIKTYYILFILLVVSCSKPDIIEPISISTDVFEKTENYVVNGQDITFNLTSQSTYMLTIINKTTDQVVSKEKFIGKIGENKMKLYTNSLPKGYLNLVLSDENNNQLKTTIIIIN